jgi:hypothetical protein
LNISSGIALDGQGAIYISGLTHSRDFPTLGAKPSFRKDAFVTKLSKKGDRLIYSTFFPMANDLWDPISLAVDASGAVYLAGTTSSEHFPVKNAFQARYGGGMVDGFVLKLSPKGNSLIYSSYLGGSNDENLGAIVVDSTGKACISGGTNSKNFPLKKPIQGSLGGGGDAFITKVSKNGKSLIFSTYLGGHSSTDSTDSLTRP